MTMHYHGTPISPISALYQLAGRCFCVSFAYPQDIKRCHQIGQSVMLDNGAFSRWKINKQVDWPGYYSWCDEWLSFPNTWAVIPDAIDAGPEAQESLLAQWPHGRARGSPVWHMNEPIERLTRLIDEWPRVCIGSTSIYAEVLSSGWQRRMDAAWNAIGARHRRLPWIHMLRGMQCAGERWPFASLDSTDVARNHNRDQNTPHKIAARWDRIQCPARWEARPEQTELTACQA